MASLQEQLTTLKDPVALSWWEAVKTLNHDDALRSMNEEGQKGGYNGDQTQVIRWLFDLSHVNEPGEDAWVSFHFLFHCTNRSVFKVHGHHAWANALKALVLEQVIEHAASIHRLGTETLGLWAWSEVYQGVLERLNGLSRAQQDVEWDRHLQRQEQVDAWVEMPAHQWSDLKLEAPGGWRPFWKKLMALSLEDPALDLVDFWTSKLKTKADWSDLLLKTAVENRMKDTEKVLKAMPFAPQDDSYLYVYRALHQNTTALKRWAGASLFTREHALEPYSPLSGLRDRLMPSKEACMGGDGLRVNGFKMGLALEDADLVQQGMQCKAHLRQDWSSLWMVTSSLGELPLSERFQAGCVFEEEWRVLFQRAVEARHQPLLEALWDHQPSDWHWGFEELMWLWLKPTWGEAGERVKSMTWVMHHAMSRPGCDEVQQQRAFDHAFENLKGDADKLVGALEGLIQVGCMPDAMDESWVFLKLMARGEDSFDTGALFLERCHAPHGVLDALVSCLRKQPLESDSTYQKTLAWAGVQQEKIALSRVIPARPPTHQSLKKGI